MNSERAITLCVASPSLFQPPDTVSSVTNHCSLLSQWHWYTCSNVSNTRCRWNVYKPKRVSDSKLNTVGEENHLLISDIVKTSVWSGVRYELPAEASSNNDVAHSWLDHVARNVVRTRSRNQPQAAILPQYAIASLTSPIKTTFVKNTSPLRILLRRWQ